MSTKSISSCGPEVSPRACSQDERNVSAEILPRLLRAHSSDTVAVDSTSDNDAGGGTPTSARSAGPSSPPHASFPASAAGRSSIHGKRRPHSRRRRQSSRVAPASWVCAAYQNALPRSVETRYGEIGYFGGSLAPIVIARASAETSSPRRERRTPRVHASPSICIVARSPASRAAPATINGSTCQAALIRACEGSSMSSSAKATGIAQVASLAWAVPASALGPRSSWRAARYSAHRYS